MGVFAAWITPALTALGLAHGGSWIWVASLFIFAVHPALDLLGEAIRWRPKPPPAVLYPWVVAVAPFVMGLVLGLGLMRVRADGSWLEPALAAGVCTGAYGIVSAHELVHRPERWLRALGILSLAFAFYVHYRIEHLYGHHRWVGTPKDPATARKGESLYRFWARSVPQGFVSAWRHDRAQSVRRLPKYLVLPFTWLALAYVFAGLHGVAFVLVQALVGVLLLETTNYIEHYGLVRKLRSDGSYAPVAPEHAWDTEAPLTNLTLFRLGYHSDHHLHASRPFPALTFQPKAPLLPAGYSCMLPIALLPPLWRWVMDRRLGSIQNTINLIN